MKFDEVYFEAIKVALAPDVRVYHYASDFADLWSDRFESNGKPVVIVWDRTSLGSSENPHDSLLEPHLTPLDWVLAWSVERARHGFEIPPVVIIDTRMDSWGHGWAWAVRRQLLADMPWVSLVSPLARPSGVNSLRLPIISAAGDGAHAGGVVRNDEGKWKLDTQWQSRALSEREIAAMQSLWRLWAASLSQSDEHHDINNIVGAWILIRNCADSSVEAALKSAPPIVACFLQKVEWLRGKAGSGIDWDVWTADAQAKEVFAENEIYLTLYDDMYEAGWNSFLMHFLRKLPCNDAPAASPTELVEFLSERAVFDKRDFYQNAHEGGNGHPELIFLDFQLYSRRAHEQFLEDTRALLSVAKTIEQYENLAWAAIELKEIKEIQAWLDAGAPDDHHSSDQALLLLPRLLALALPLTPIIMFSSTAQARIRDQLKDYGNVFTGFQKPNPLGDPGSVATAIAALNRAMDRAMLMLERGLQLSRAQSIFCTLDRDRPKQLSGYDHIEVYFDESGTYGRDHGLYSVATIVPYNSIIDADTINEKVVDFIFRRPEKFKRNPERIIPSWVQVKDLSLYSSNVDFQNLALKIYDDSVRRKDRTIEKTSNVITSQLGQAFYSSIKRDMDQRLGAHVRGALRETEKLSKGKKDMGPARRVFAASIISHWLPTEFRDFEGKSYGKPLFAKFERVKSDSIARKQSRFVQRIFGHHAKFPAVLVGAKCRPPAPGKGLAGFKDMVLDEAIRCNIDFIFTCFSDYHFVKPPTVSVYLPTRSHAGGEAGFIQRFGPVYGQETAFPLLRGWLQRWGDAAWSLAGRVHAARSRQLDGGQGITRAKLTVARVISDIGDWGANFFFNRQLKTEKFKKIEPALLESGIFKDFYSADMLDKDACILRDALVNLLSREDSNIGVTVSLICTSAILSENRSVNSEGFEPLWLWSIFPHIAKKAGGKDLLAGIHSMRG